jgi:DNA-binding winged helix-turn-helix (wHTH) protein
LLKNIILENPSVYSLANRIKIMPLISGGVLKTYIHQRATEYKKQLSDKDIENISQSTGGLLFLTREIIRNFPNEGLLNERLLSIWKKIPQRYKTAFESKDRIQDKDLESFGVSKLNLFKSRIEFLNSNPEKLMVNSLNETELNIYKIFKSNKGRLVTRDQVAKTIWGNNFEEQYSDWAIDQTISRFRKKIGTFHILKESVKTIKGKGYKWRE